jgi:osomolarity two-component system response regulator SKN7
MFKHSNFASFVRQLNKYDFHKVKNTDDNQFGEHSWTFRHPDFHADRRDALENIKRKVPAVRKSASTLPLSSHPYSSSGRGRSTSPSSVIPPHLAGLPGNSYGQNPNVPILQAEIHRLREEGDDLRERIRNLERNYETVLVEMLAFQRGMAQQDGLMQNFIDYFLGSESGK